MLLAVATAAGAALGDMLSAADVHRASTKVPRGLYKGASQTSLSRVLNGHLLWSERFAVACEDWTSPELQDFMGTIDGHRNPALQDIYL